MHVTKRLLLCHLKMEHAQDEMEQKFSMQLFPLNIAHVMTVHKLQGRSIKNLVVTA